MRNQKAVSLLLGAAMVGRRQESFLLERNSPLCGLTGVSSRVIINKVFTLVCVITLLAAQAFGGFAGYLCRCGGQESLTQVDHCHGPHSSECHDKLEVSELLLASSDVHADENCSDREEHEPVVNPIQGVPSSGTSAPPLFSVLLAIIPALPFPNFLKEDTALKDRFSGFESPPPLGVIVGRTTALVI